MMYILYMFSLYSSYPYYVHFTGRKTVVKQQICIASKWQSQKSSSNLPGAQTQAGNGRTRESDIFLKQGRRLRSNSLEAEPESEIQIQLIVLRRCSVGDACKGGRKQERDGKEQSKNVASEKI